MTIGFPPNPPSHSMPQVRFSGWEPGITSQPIHDLINTIEDTLSLPIQQPSTPPLAGYPAEAQPKILSLQDILKKVESNNGYGFESAIEVLRTLDTTGYQLTRPETEKLKMLVQKDTYGLESAITHFPLRNEYDRSNGSYTMKDFLLYVPQWLKLQNSYASISRLVKTIEKSSKFKAPVEIQTAILTRLNEMNQTYQTDLEARQTFLKSLGSTFRPKAVLAQELKKVMETLFPPEGLFAAQTVENNQQVIDLIAQRDTTIEFAGRTAQGAVYIYTKNQTDNSKKFYYGLPGEVKALTIVSGIRASDGSETILRAEGDLDFQFFRGGIFSDPKNTSLWRATLNNEPIPQEYPLFKLSQ